MRSLKKQLVFTSLLVSSLAFIALLIQIYSNTLLYRHSHNVTNNQLPFTMEINKLGEDLNLSLDLLKSWVLLGDEKSKNRRKKLWLYQIEPTLSSLELRITKSGDLRQKALFEQSRTSMRHLYSSQWWVEDVSSYIGNQPALVLYQRDLLPIYSHIQSALQGIENPLIENDDSSDLKLLVSNAHVLLSETMLQLSQVILTGEITHINRFRGQADIISTHLVQLAKTQTLDEDAKKLILWISGQYNHYVNLSEKITRERLASDWNQGLYILNIETIPLMESIKNTLQQLQQTHIKKLETESVRIENTSYTALVASILLLLISAAWAIYYSMSHAQKLVDKINRLKIVALNIAQGKQMQLNVHYVDELDELAKTFNQMQTMLFRRRKKFIRERERLTEVVHIISHDIKAPLINIRGHAKLIKNDLVTLDQKQTESITDIQESLQHILFSTERISTLITGILQFSSVIQKDIKMFHVNPKVVLQDLIVINSSRIKPEQITFSNLPDKIISDAFSLQIIFSTLLDNAIKYQHPERELVIQVCYDNITSMKLHKFFIIDNGLGILGEDKDKVFKLFVNSSNVKSGSGIGLASARSLAEKLNGDIEFYNNKNEEGVTFVVSLHCYEKTPDKALASSD